MVELLKTIMQLVIAVPEAKQNKTNKQSFNSFMATNGTSPVVTYLKKSVYLCLRIYVIVWVCISVG